MSVIGWWMVFLICAGMMRVVQGDFDPERMPLPDSVEERISMLGGVVIMGMALWMATR